MYLLLSKSKIKLDYFWRIRIMGKIVNEKKILIIQLDYEFWLRVLLKFDFRQMEEGEEIESIILIKGI